MKLLFDQNISPKILKILPDTLYDATHVNFNKLQDKTDLEIFSFAKNNGYCIVTQDSDFNDLLRLKGFPPKVIWFRLGNTKTAVIANILTQKHYELMEFYKSKETGLFEITKFKVIK